METDPALAAFLSAIEAARPFLRGRPLSDRADRRGLRGKWYRDSLDLAWACVYVLEQGPAHFAHLSFPPAALRADLERLRDLQVARDAAQALLCDTEAELDARKLDVAARAREVVRSIQCRLGDPQHRAHAGLAALSSRVLQILDRRSDRLRAAHHRAALQGDAAALAEENRRMEDENRRLGPGPSSGPRGPSMEGAGGPIAVLFRLKGDT